MADQSFKLAIDTATTTDVEVKPEIEKHFYLLMNPSSLCLYSQNVRFQLY